MEFQLALALVRVRVVTLGGSRGAQRSPAGKPRPNAVRHVPVSPIWVPTTPCIINNEIVRLLFIVNVIITNLDTLFFLSYYRTFPLQYNWRKCMLFFINYRFFFVKDKPDGRRVFE